SSRPPTPRNCHAAAGRPASCGDAGGPAETAATEAQAPHRLSRHRPRTAGNTKASPPWLRGLTPSARRPYGAGYSAVIAIIIGAAVLVPQPRIVVGRGEHRDAAVGVVPANRTANGAIAGRDWHVNLIEHRIGGDRVGVPSGNRLACREDVLIDLRPL